MRILCGVEDEERQGWALAFQELGHAFSFYDGKLAMHHVCDLFKPDIFICHTKNLNRAAQNACKRFGTWIYNIEFADIPICANTFLPKVQKPREPYIAIFGDETPENNYLAQKFFTGCPHKIFNETKWGLNEYCGFPSKQAFANICASADSTVILGRKMSMRHIQAAYCGAILFHNLDQGTTPIGNNLVKWATDQGRKSNPRKENELKAFYDQQTVIQNYNCRSVPGLILEDYEKDRNRS